MPRIAVDATSLSARATGAGRVLRNLLAALPAVDTSTEYVALATAEGAAALANGGPEIQIHRVAPSQGIRWELAGAAAAARSVHADLLFTTRELIGRRRPPTVLHLFEPPSYRLRRGFPTKPLAKDTVLSTLLPGTVRRAAAVTAGSATTAAWLRGRFGLEATVVPPGLEAVFFDSNVEPVRRESEYLLYLATGDPREESGLLLAALVLLGAEAPPLVVAGSHSNQLALDGARLGLAGRIEPLGWVSDQELRALYRGALAFVHPTRYEGYGGFPVLEAMALGTPVVALRAPGSTEALEGAALLVARAEPELLADALREVSGDLPLREHLSRAGSERVEPLRWERAASEFAGVFHRVLGIA